MRKKLWTILLTAFVFLSGTALGLSTVYRVQDVTVNVSYVTDEARAEGETLQMLLQDAYKGNATFFAKRETADEVMKNYPYFRITGFEKSYPKRLIIDVMENAEVYAVERSEGEYYVLSADGVVLDVRDTHVNPLNGEANVKLKGLNADLEKGAVPTGDDCFAPMLALCQQFSESLNGIRSNVDTVELIRRSPEVILAVTMREGVRIYISNPSALTKEKTAVALGKYFTLTAEEKTTGRILLFENSGKIFSDYASVDEFQ